MRKVILFISLVLFLTLPATAQKKEVEWKSFEELAKASTAEPRPVLVYISSPGCGWCRKMENETFKDKQLSGYVNDKYYAVQMSVVSREDIIFNGKLYKYNSRNGVHDLAMYLTYGRMTFPHTILLASPGAQPAPFSGYMPAKNMESPIKYFGERIEESYVIFNKNLQKAWK